MRMAAAGGAKQDFATRLSRETLAQLDELVRSGTYRNRTAAIEAAVGRLYEIDRQDVERRRQAFARSCGALNIGVDRDAVRRAELDRLDWEARGR
jgi:Arc/MetJ-type ribon-helix-helix transcriptional regulator